MANYVNPGIAVLNTYNRFYEASSTKIKDRQEELSAVEWRIGERAKLVSVITKAEVAGKAQIDLEETEDLRQLSQTVFSFAGPKIDSLGKGSILKKDAFTNQITLIKEASAQDHQNAVHGVTLINQVYQDMKDSFDIFNKMIQDLSDSITRILRKMAS